MQLPITEIDLAQRIAWAIGATFDTAADGSYALNHSRLGLSMSSADSSLGIALSELAPYSIVEETALFSDTIYEVLIYKKSRRLTSEDSAKIVYA